MRGFSTKALTSRSHDMSGYIKESVERLRSHMQHDHAPVNIEPFIGNAVLDIHAKLTIGHDFEAVTEGPRLHSLIKRMHSATTVIQYCVLLTYLPFGLKNLPSLFGGADVFSVFSGLQPIGPAIARRVDRQSDSSEDDISKCIQSCHSCLCGEKLTQKVSHMQHAKDSNDVNKNELTKNSYVFILSGIESVPGFVCSSLYYMLESPRYYARASDEIRSKFQNADEITAATAQEIPFLRAIIQETLRVSPPFVGALPRTVPRKGSQICGRFVAEGMTVGIHNYSVTHYQPFWKDADSFRPERWLGDAEFASDHREAFHPFGNGPRMCVARQYVISCGFHHCRNPTLSRVLTMRVVWFCLRQVCCLPICSIILI